MSKPVTGLRPILTLPGLDGYGPDDLPDVERTDGVPELRLALAQARAEQELGYRIPPVADPAAHPQERIVEWTATVGRHQTAILAADLDEHACVADLVEHRLAAAVAATVATRSAEPAREEVAILVAADGGRTGRAVRLAAEVLGERLAEPTPAASAEGAALGWVAAHLGPDIAAQAREAIGIPVADATASTVTALLWLAAGAAAG
ncbi:hypothetical protein [Pseudonocardia sp. N23]|uniref:hypothetical protein n=1 Tax=Pseudonocardia sp. N23 TaxID=1987376 RepID=UPI000BFDFE50|nr:hypothetical protein [Pseudonocardia sp. N23]GAY10835.1 hypothetical protein TOK_5197 [Pseudonocardia sp. N23]